MAFEKPIETLFSAFLLIVLAIVFYAVIASINPWIAVLFALIVAYIIVRVVKGGT